MYPIIDEESFFDYNSYMKYQVRIKKSCLKAISKLSGKDKETLAHLLSDLGESGPVQPGYKNYSKLGDFTIASSQLSLGCLLVLS